MRGVGSLLVFAVLLCACGGGSGGAPVAPAPTLSVQGQWAWEPAAFACVVPPGLLSGEEVFDALQANGLVTASFQDSRGNAVSVSGGVTGTRLAATVTLTLPGDGTGEFVCDRAYVTHPGVDDVAILDFAGPPVPAPTIAAGPPPHSLNGVPKAFTGRFVTQYVVATSANAVTVIDVAAAASVQSVTGAVIDGPTDAAAVETSAGRRKLYVTNAGDGTGNGFLTVLDASGAPPWPVVRTVPLQGRGTAAACRYVLNGKAVLAVVHALSGTVQFVDPDTDVSILGPLATVPGARDCAMGGAPVGGFRDLYVAGDGGLRAHHGADLGLGNAFTPLLFLRCHRMATRGALLAVTHGTDTAPPPNDHGRFSQVDTATRTVQFTEILDVPQAPTVYALGVDACDAGLTEGFFFATRTGLVQKELSTSYRVFRNITSEETIFVSDVHVVKGEKLEQGEARRIVLTLEADLARVQADVRVNGRVRVTSDTYAWCIGAEALFTALVTR